MNNKITQPELADQVQLGNVEWIMAVSAEAPTRRYHIAVKVTWHPEELILVTSSRGGKVRTWSNIDRLLKHITSSYSDISHFKIWLNKPQAN